MTPAAPWSTKLDAAQRAFRAFSDGSPYGLLLIDRDLVIRWASPTMHDLTRFPHGNLIGRVANDFVHPEDFPVLSAILDETAARRRRSAAPADDDPPPRLPARELRLRHRVDEWVRLEASGAPLFDDPDVQGGLLIVRDTTDQRDLDAALELLADDAPLEDVLDAVLTLLARELRPAKVALVYEDSRGIVRHVGNPAFAAVLRSHWRRRPPHREMVSIPVSEAAGFAEIWEIPFGGSQDDAAVGAIYVLSTAADRLRTAPLAALRRGAHIAGLAVRRRHARAALVHVASRDALTGLHNRVALGELVDRLSDQPKTTDDRPVVGVLYCDLDGFVDVNERYGHTGGDRVLRVAAERIVHEARSADMCARVGGDEFVIVCSRLRDNRFAQALAHRLVRRFSQPIALHDGAVDDQVDVEGGEASVTVGMRIGVATTRYPAQIPNLVGAADRARHRAKDRGEPTEIDVLGPPLVDREGSAGRLDLSAPEVDG
jgi:diguanylate cyclase (GGDEF)-like protein